ncbi:phytoene desaturase family protein [Corynebacterium neomassiliense]|uniref:phytoene desaturase family protein n=1 Tax=Corynebacterium neomassiliense TaxID=2079482 RepID=UPI00102FC008|nr:phytoene desaturase family protein [Corynebacterium neomassiliense]
MTARGSGDPVRVVVVGGGVAGLATAGLLSRHGYSVTLLERNDDLGGRAGSLTTPWDGGTAFRWDTGPSWYLMPEAFDRFYSLMGTDTAHELDLVDLSPGYRVLSEGLPPVDVPVGEDPVADLFESLEPGAGHEVRRYLREAGDTYRTAVDRFLYTSYTSPAPFLAPEVLKRSGRLARLLTGSLENLVDRRFNDRRLRQILSYPAVFLSSRPSALPAMYQLMSYTDLVQGVKYPVGGFAAVVDSLHRLAVGNGAQVRTGAEVTSVRTDRPRANPLRRVPGLGRIWPARARATGVELADGTVVPADVVVSAADLHHTETTLVPEGLRTYPERHWGKVDAGVGAVVVMLGVRGALPELAHHTLIFSRDWGPDFAAVFDGGGTPAGQGVSQSVYVSRPSATDPAVAPDGYENLFILVPAAADPSLGHGDHAGEGSVESAGVARIADRVTELVADRAGIPDLASRVVVRHTLGPADFADRYNSWHGWALGLAHTLRQSAFLRGTNRSRAVSNLFYAGSTTTPGVGVPMCLISAENVLERLETGRETPGRAPLPDSSGSSR